MSIILSILKRNLEKFYNDIFFSLSIKTMNLKEIFSKVCEKYCIILECDEVIISDNIEVRICEKIYQEY